MKTLRVIGRRAGSARDGDFEVALRDPDGAVLARSSRAADGSLALSFPEIALFTMRPGRTEVLAEVEEGATTDAVEDAFATMAMPLLLQAEGAEALHASAVEHRGRLALLCAVSGVGKSTTAYVLGQRRFSQWSDDVVVFRAGRDRRPVASALPYTPRLRPASMDRFGSESAPRPSSEEVAEIGIIIHLVRSSSSPPFSARRLGLAEGLEALLPHAFRFGLEHDASRRRSMGAYLSLVSAVPVVEVRFVPGWAHFEELISGVERLIEEALDG